MNKSNSEVTLKCTCIKEVNDITSSEYHADVYLENKKIGTAIVKTKNGDTVADFKIDNMKHYNLIKESRNDGMSIGYIVDGRNYEN